MNVGGGGAWRGFFAAPLYCLLSIHQCCSTTELFDLQDRQLGSTGSGNRSRTGQERGSAETPNSVLRPFYCEYVPSRTIQQESNSILPD